MLWMHGVWHRGETRIDPYHWMRDDNWQEVPRDPTVLRDDVRAHLEAENAYNKAKTDHLEDLRQVLFGEPKLLLERAVLGDGPCQGVDVDRRRGRDPHPRL